MKLFGFSMILYKSYYLKRSWDHIWNILYDGFLSYHHFDRHILLCTNNSNPLRSCSALSNKIHIEFTSLYKFCKFYHIDYNFNRPHNILDHKHINSFINSCLFLIYRLNKFCYQHKICIWYCIHNIYYSIRNNQSDKYNLYFLKS